MKVAGLIVLMWIASFGAVFSQNSTVQAVRKLERAWLDAYEQNDAKAMNEIVADDFVITFPDGSMQTKAQILTAIKMARPAGSPKAKFSTEHVTPHVYGDTVVLTGRVVTELSRNGETISTNRQRYTDTYVKRNGRWQVVASHLSNAVQGQKP
jgi:uncharacterized protein (TIGR02246 family)